MIESLNCHIATVGWDPSLIVGIYDRIADKFSNNFSHLPHPKYTPYNWPIDVSKENIHFIGKTDSCEMPPPNYELLASLERNGIPTIHNMIMGDRVVSKLDYDDALSYATFLVGNMIEKITAIRPSIVIGAIDGIHGSLGLAVCKYLNVPWFCLHFSIIPPGHVCFCDNVLPAARISLDTKSSMVERQALASESLRRFENRDIEAMAYIAPKPLSILGKLWNLPTRIGPLIATISRGRRSKTLRYTEGVARYSVMAALIQFMNASRARSALARLKVLSEPIESPFVFFGLHMQPESTVDVWAPFYSNQIWVIELLARSLPPTHKLLVKIHKSDVSNYSRQQLKQITSLPSVEIVEPFADSQRFIKKADLIVSIQGTIGLEGALYGKPVIMLGDSPNLIFSSVSCIGNLADLPALVREKLSAQESDREQIVADYANFLRPFMPASSNDWSGRKSDEEIDGYVRLFGKLSKYVRAAKKDVS